MCTATELDEELPGKSFLQNLQTVFYPFPCCTELFKAMTATKCLADTAAQWPMKIKSFASELGKTFNYTETQPLS